MHHVRVEYCFVSTNRLLLGVSTTQVCSYMGGTAVGIMHVSQRPPIWGFWGPAQGDRRVAGGRSAYVQQSGGLYTETVMI